MHKQFATQKTKRGSPELAVREVRMKKCSVWSGSCALLEAEWRLWDFHSP